MLRNMSQINVKLGIQTMLGRVNEAFALRNAVSDVTAEWK